jgi:FtsH-binding integral membrane protein
MNILREVAGELLNMFVGDVALTVGILIVVSLTGLLTRLDAVPPLFGGAILFLGCIIVLVASVGLAGWRYRNR